MLTPGLWAIVDELTPTAAHLHIVQLLQTRPQLRTSAGALAELLCRDVWSVGAALDELCSLHICARSTDGDGPYHYVFAPSAARQQPLQHLLRAFEDPLLRDQLQRRISTAAAQRGRVLQRDDGYRTGRFGEHGLLLTEL